MWWKAVLLLYTFVIMEIMTRIDLEAARQDGIAEGLVLGKKAVSENVSDTRAA